MPDDDPSGVSFGSVDISQAVAKTQQTLTGLKAILDQLDKARSVACIINNVTDLPLTYGGDSTQHGGFATDPPASIPPRTSVAFSAQSKSGSLFTGTEGRVWYNAPDGASFEFYWDNPWDGDNDSDAKVRGPLGALYTTDHVTGSGNEGAQMVFNAIQRMPTVFREVWIRTGGATGLLGMVTSDPKPTPDGIGVFMEFEGGAVYSSPSSGTHDIAGVIRDKWATLQWEQGVLGYPVSDVFSTRDGGQFSHFQHGSIYWSQNTGAFEVHGPIHDKWRDLRWEKSFLGYPVSDVHDSPDGKELVSKFQHGEIHLDKATGHVNAYTQFEIDHGLAGATVDPGSSRTGPNRPGGSRPPFQVQHP
jgi:uncharacterized protein with LGFP repeats